jgi:hypothetical protein
MSNLITDLTRNVWHLASVPFVGPTIIRRAFSNNLRSSEGYTPPSREDYANLFLSTATSTLTFGTPIALALTDRSFAEFIVGTNISSFFYEMARDILRHGIRHYRDHSLNDEDGIK